MTTKPRLYHYKACGLDNVFLLNGFSYEDTEYGQTICFEDIEGLHALIANYLVNHDRHLSGKELRFLRKEIELSQKELARLLGCDEQTVGRWERGETLVPGPADRMVRVLYQENYSQNPHVRDLLERIATLVQDEEQKALSDLQMHFTRDADEWKIAA